MAEFPTDIVADILSRLPVEPLLRFRCVSKPWCALIDSPHFVQLHLKRSIESKSNRQIILSDDNSSLYSVSMMMDSSLDAAVKLNLPPFNNNCTNDEYRRPVVLDSCDGIVLLILYPEKELAIWNPSTRKYLVLPVCTTPVVFEEDECAPIDLCGIGYDSVNDDYKVLKIFQFFIGQDSVALHTHVQIYSLKMNSWRKLNMDFPYCLTLDGPRFGMLASGALHWLASETVNGIDSLIVAFDLATEEFMIVPMPCFDHKDSVDLYVEVTSLEGLLCILCKKMGESFNVWVMKDYGVKESWTKLLLIPLQSPTEPLDFAVPVTLSMDGTKLLWFQDDTTLIWYDLKQKLVQIVNIRGLRNIYSVQFCMQSLVPLGRDDTGNVMIRSACQRS